MYGQPRMRVRPYYEMVRLAVIRFNDLSMSSATGVKRAHGAQIWSQSDSDSEIYTGASLNPVVDPIDRTKLKELCSGARGEILGLPASYPELILQHRVIFRVTHVSIYVLRMINSDC